MVGSKMHHSVWCRVTASEIITHYSSETTENLSKMNQIYTDKYCVQVQNYDSTPPQQHVADISLHIKHVCDSVQMEICSSFHKRQGSPLMKFVSKGGAQAPVTAFVL